MATPSIPYPNPEKQETFDAVLKRLLEDEKYLHFAYALTELTQGQYNVTYELVTYRPDEDEEQPKREPEGKYAVKFF